MSIVRCPRRLLRPIWSRHVDADHPRVFHSRQGAVVIRLDLTSMRAVGCDRASICLRAHGTTTALPVMADAERSSTAFFYVMRAGCPWRLLPSDLPPWGTIYRLVRQVPRRRPPCEDQSLSGHGRSRAGRTRGQPERRDYRQPEQSRRPRLVAPAATMRARRSRGASATRWSTPTGLRPRHVDGASGEVST